MARANEEAPGGFRRDNSRPEHSGAGSGPEEWACGRSQRPETSWSTNSVTHSGCYWHCCSPRTILGPWHWHCLHAAWPAVAVAAVAGDGGGGDDGGFHPHAPPHWD